MKKGVNMIYLWRNPDFLDKYIPKYEHDLSPDQFLFLEGVSLTKEEVSRCYSYVRREPLDLPDDPLIRMQIRHFGQAAYIITSGGLFSCIGGMGRKVSLTLENLKKFKSALSLPDQIVDQPPIVLSDTQLQTIISIPGCPPFSRIPIISMHRAKMSEILNKFDCIPNHLSFPLVNQKVMDLLLRVAPDDVQFFDTEIHCKDGVLRDYKIVNITHQIHGIDHEKSINVSGGRGIKNIVYKPGCMGTYQLARETEDYRSDLLVSDEVKQAFEKEKIKGVDFQTPYDFYSSIYPALREECE